MKIHGTAKGAALSTKDFGVAFGGAAVVPSFVCQEATGDAFSLGGSGGVRTKAGVRVLANHLAIGKTVTEVKFFLKKLSTPTGNINLAVWNGAVNQNVGGSTLDVSTLDDASYTLKTFEMEHTIAVNDDIVLECTINGIRNGKEVYLSQNTDNTVFPYQISVNYEGGWAIYPGRNCYWCYLGS